MTVVDEKKAAREAAILVRDRTHAILCDTAPAGVAANFAKSVRLAEGTIVSGYWPGRSELDIRPLMEALHARGHAIALPVVMGRGQPLVFRAWRPGMALEEKKFGLREPGADAAMLTPRALLVPFLAFDEQGYRIGYGAGYYDMTLAELRSRLRVLAIGVGYSAQRVDRLPRDGHDQRLDWVVTEAGAVQFGD